MLKTVLLVTVGVASLALPSIATAEVYRSRQYGRGIEVAGRITREDLKDLLAYVRSQREREPGAPFTVELNSRGGDVETALAMGRILRLQPAIAVVPKGGNCFSSCVFLLAGAKFRWVYGDVGIHRPYAPLDTVTTLAAQKQRYERVEKEVKAFLQAVNVPQELYDHMIRIPPERVKVLSNDELQRYGLNEDDPYESAAQDAGVAKSYGISTEEYIRRKQKALAECVSGNAKDNQDCYHRIVNPAATTLIIRTTPAGARVLINDIDRGYTPGAFTELTFGSHKVVVVHPGYEDAERTITLTPAQPSQSIDVTLSPILPPAPNRSSPGAAKEFSLQVATVESRTEADDHVSRLLAAGFPAFILEPAAGTPQIFRVRVGPYKTRMDAEVAAKDVSKLLYSPWIVR